MDILWTILGLAAFLALLVLLAQQVRRDGYGSTPPPVSHASSLPADATRGTPYF
ncbi:hypothetical protein [Cellulomonas timonensis]|uniref:hypothetical protein n=1 Tax=Cellulomonas timonensis TaxID=1689271 RepID=UPI000A97A8E3|nr:hypothetical protein [Cellulomonas timonensis]